MDEFDYWRLCDDLSVSQAALLVIGKDPSGANSYIEGWDVHKRPHGYEAAKTAIANGLRRSSIEGELNFESEHDLDGNEIGATNVIDAISSIVSVESLRKFLTARGINTGFFFPSGFDNRSYLDRDNSYYAPKLAAAVNGWEAVSSDENLLNGKTPKQAIEKWLREHASEYGLVGEDGSPMATAIEQISKVTNWKPGGGAARTPTPPQVSANPNHQEKGDVNQSDDLSDDEEIPF